MKRRAFKFLMEFFIDDLFKYFRKNKMFFILGLIFLFLSGIIQLIIPLVFGKMIGNITETTNFLYPDLSSFVIIFGIVLLQFSFMFGRDYFFMRFSLNGISNLKKSLFEKLLRLPMSYHNRNSVGGSMSILNNDIETIKNLYSLQLSQFLYNLLILIAATVILLTINYKLSIILMSIFALSIVVVYSFSKKIRGIAVETQQLNFSLSSKLEESLQKIRTIKIFTSESLEVKIAKEKIDKVFLELKRNEILSSVLSLVSMFFIMASLLFMIWYASYMIVGGEITVGDTIPIIVNLLFIVYSISGISKFLGNLEKARGTTLRLVDILNSDNEYTSNNKELKNELFNNKISMMDAGLAYENLRNQVLSNLTFEIRKGEKIAIIGKNGSGKSSILNMLLRLYPRNQGDIFIDNRDIETVKLQDYRNCFSVVSQDISLFNMSIDENICYPNLKMDSEKLAYVKKLANINFSMEDAHDRIGKNGELLSGGQKQKISLARALYKDAEILILDEVTNSLDQDTRSLLNDGFFQDYLNKKTVIFISHEMELIKNVDKIFILESGKIIKECTHESLIRDNHDPTIKKRDVIQM